MVAGINNHYSGAASEFMVAAHLSRTLHDVFFPATPSRADLIYTPIGGSAVRAQVKTTTRSKTGPYEYEQCRLVRKSDGDPYTEDEVDEVWVVGTHMWRFPIEAVSGRTSLALLSNGPTGGTDKPYAPDDHIIIQGEWDKPVRNFL